MSLRMGTFSLEPSLLYNKTCADPDIFFSEITNNYTLKNGVYLKLK